MKKTGRKNQELFFNQCLMWAVAVPVLSASIAVHANPVMIRKQMGETG